jgi:hypothetical protein
MKRRGRTHFLNLSLPELIKNAERVAGKFWKAAADGNGLHPIPAGLGFLMAEAETGLTFAGIALAAAGDDVKVQRNTANARKAYDTVLRFRGRLSMAPEEIARLSSRVEQLRWRLQVLGEWV